MHHEDINFHETENPHYYVESFVSAMTLNRIDKDIFHLLFPWTFDKDVIRWYNVIDPRKVTKWDDLCRGFLCQYSYNADLPFTLRDLELIKQEENKEFFGMFSN